MIRPRSGCRSPTTLGMVLSAGGSCASTATAPITGLVQTARGTEVTVDAASAGHHTRTVDLR
jgi:hypothetical protein